MHGSPHPLGWTLGLLLSSAAVLPEDLEADFDKNHRRAAPRDTFPVLDHPEMLSPEQAEEGGAVSATDFVIGVAYGGEARAYPVAIMGRHELANDTIAGLPIAVSW